MTQDTASQEKWVLYFYISGKTNPVACENTPEELMTKAGIGRPIQWTDQGGCYIGIPFGGKMPADFYYTINQDGENIYKVVTGQKPERRHNSAFDNVAGALARLLDKVTR